CGGERIPPKALVDARNEFSRAKSGITVQLDPTDVHEADLALQRAGNAFNNDPDEPTTIDPAVIAPRKAQIAQGEAAAMKAGQDADAAKAELSSTVQAQLKQTRGQLSQTQQTLSQAQMTVEQQKAAAAEQQKKLADLEAKLKDARDTIAKIAAVKD